MILLPNGCHMSTPSVFPKNWRVAKSTKDQWCIVYRFYDPAFRDNPKFKHGKQVRLRGMNEFKNVQERKDATEFLIERTINLHLHEGFNPITNVYKVPVQIVYEIDPNTPVCKALDLAVDKLKCEKRTKIDVKNSLTYINKSFKALGYHTMPISAISRKHIRAMLDNCENVKAYFSANQFNNYRKYLSMLFKELLELETVDVNPVRDIAKRKQTLKIRETLSMDERVVVHKHLYDNHYEFWRYMQIFFHSGRRTTELLLIKFEDVDIANQRIKITEKKGKQFRQKWSPIKNVALPLWSEIMNQAKPNEYIFSRRLKPGSVQLGHDQITKRWKRNVKDVLGITADFYSLKHSNADDIAKMYGIGTAKDFIGHSTERMTRLYATGQNQRDLDAMKLIDNGFVE